MAKSKAVTKKEASVKKSEKPTEAPLTTKVQNGSPYQLDPAQVERAATALIKNMKQHAQEKEEKGKKNLLAADDDAPEKSYAVIFLTLSTKQHVKDSSRLKPSKMYVSCNFCRGTPLTILIAPFLIPSRATMCAYVS
jgi:ribosome biogenesis protein UTP30